MALTSHAFKEGEWVTQIRGCCRGRIGRVDELTSGLRGSVAAYVVQFGAGGPFQKLREKSIRLATPEEIAFVHGCRVRDLPEGMV